MTVTLTEDEKRALYLLEGMAEGIKAAGQCLMRDIAKKHAQQPAPPPPEPPKKEE